MSAPRASNLNSPSSPRITSAPARVGEGVSQLKHNILAWDSAPLRSADTTAHVAVPTLGTSPGGSLRGTLLREGIFPTEPANPAITPTSANTSNPSLSNNHTNHAAAGGGNALLRPSATQRRAPHPTTTAGRHTNSNAAHVMGSGVNSPASLPAIATGGNGVEDELAATGQSFEVESGVPTTVSDRNERDKDDDESAAPLPSPQPTPLARPTSPPSAAAAAEVTPEPRTGLAATSHPFCNYFKPAPEPGRQRWLLSFNAASPSNGSIVGGAAGNAGRGTDYDLGSPAWRQSSDVLQGWTEMCTGGCALRKNTTGSHLLLITEENTVTEEPLVVVSCANCVLLRAAVCLPRGKPEACFSAQAQYRYALYGPNPSPTARERGPDDAVPSLVFIGLGLTPRLNEELKGGFYLVLAQLNKDGVASLSVGLWRVTERDTMEQVRVLRPPQPVRLAHDRLTLRLVIREGEFDVYANDVAALRGGPVAAPGVKLGESYALLMNTGGAVSLRHVALAEGERPPESRVFQCYTATTTRGNSPATLHSPHTGPKQSPPLRGCNSPTQQQQQQPSRPVTGRDRASRGNSPPSGANSTSPPIAPTSPGKTTTTRTTGGQPTTRTTSGRGSPAGPTMEHAPLPPPATAPLTRPTRRGSHGARGGTTRAAPHGARRGDGEDVERGTAETLPANVDPQLAAVIQAEIMEKVPQVSWDDIAGLADGKRLLKEAVLLPLLLPELFVGVVQPWKGVLLYGPPGTGKTMLAKAVATSAKTTFFNISASTLNNKHYGESEKLVRTLFELARHYAPSTIFFDEVDALVSQRSCTEHEASRRVKSEMLQQMDGLHSSGGDGGEGRVLVLATTNRPWDLDEAIRRRLEKRIYIPLPDAASRTALLEKHTAHLKLAADVDLAAIVAATANFSGADIAVVVRDAAMMPVRRLIDTYSTEEIAQKKADGELEVTPVSMDDFRSALSRAAPSVSKDSLDRFVAWAATFGAT